MSDRIIRITTAAAVVVIGAIAAVVSFRHALEVVRVHGESGPTSYLAPLTVDGLVLVASMVLLDCSRHGEPSPVLARGALGLGIGATVAVNVLHGIAHGPIGATVAAWPAVCLVLVVELLMGMIRRSRRPPVAVEGPQVSDIPTDAETQGNASVGPQPDPLVATARDRFAEVLSAGSVPSVRAIRRELRIGHPKAVRVKEELAR